jgi:glycosyltransferase involved in cell wall biosynthesis
VILADTPSDVRISACVTLLYRARVVYRYNLAYRGSRPRLMDRLYMRRVAACIFQSRFIRREAYSHLPPLRNLPSKRVPNGYDTAFFAADTNAGLEFRKRFGIASGTDVVLTSAKLARNKGHEIALEALNLVRRDAADLVYVMCGDGPKEEQLRAYADRLSLPTIFTGLLDPDAMIGALSAADVVVHPSLREVFPNAVGEAMSCSRTVIAADAGGTDELLGRDGVTGILVPAGDVESLADAVRLLLADRQLREEIGAAARCLIEQRFPLRRMIDGYEEALAGPVRGRG